MELVIGLSLALLAIFSVSLQRTYARVPVKELRRRARSGDAIAIGLYRAVSYGHSLRAFLWVITIVTNSLFYLYVARSTDAWFAAFITGVMLWASFVWLPASEVSSFAQKIAAWIAPAIAWLLQYIHPLIDRIANYAKRHRPIRIHTGAYEKEDLIQILKQQSLQEDNRISLATIDTTVHALTFGEKLVRDVLTPRRIVTGVSTEEAIGPVLLTELHKSGLSRFPVYEDKKDNIVGILYLRDVVKAKSGGKVKHLMHKQICFIHEEQNLEEALAAILTTHQQLFIVVNSFEEYVGVLSIEDILEEVLGKQIVDEFDQYEDLRAVAAKHATSDKKAHDHPADTTDDVSEVIE